MFRDSPIATHTWWVEYNNKLASVMMRFMWILLGSLVIWPALVSAMLQCQLQPGGECPSPLLWVSMLIIMFI